MESELERLAGEIDKARVDPQCGYMLLGISAELRALAITASQRQQHNLWKDGDKGIPPTIVDRNGQVGLALCKVCGQAENELAPSCPGPSTGQRPQSDALRLLDELEQEVRSEFRCVEADKMAYPENAYAVSANRLDDWADRLAALRAALARPQQVAWMPIETAPKDGKVCVMGWGESRYRDGYGPIIMRWFSDDGTPGKGFWTCNAIQYYPTHWMPLPPEPRP